jgi:vesicle-fusing ATPase
LETFDSKLRIPPVANRHAFERVLQQVNLFQSDEEMKDAMEMLEDVGFADRDEDSQLHIGIKKLLSVIEMARQEPDNVALRLRNALIALRMERNVVERSYY